MGKLFTIILTETKNLFLSLTMELKMEALHGIMKMETRKKIASLIMVLYKLLSSMNSLLKLPLI